MAYNIVDFEKEVIERSRQLPVLVDFWAEWCGPCKILGPVLEKLAKEFASDWAFAKLNTEELPEIANEYGIRGIPNVKLFLDGKVIDEFTGALPEPMIREWLKKAMPSPRRQQVSEAVELLAANRTTEAQALLRKVLAAEPHQAPAALMLAQSLLYANPAEALQTIAFLEADSPVFQEVEGVRTLATLFEQLNQPENLPESAVREAYLDAIRQLHSGDTAAALGGFISVIEQDRYYDNDGARRACIGIFKLLGEEHALSHEYRPLFSRALYV